MTYEEFCSCLPRAMFLGGVRFNCVYTPDSRREDHFYAAYVSDTTGRKLPLRAAKVEAPWSVEHIGALLSGARRALDELEGVKSTPPAASTPPESGKRTVAIPVADAGVCIPCDMVYGGVSDSLCPACGEMLLPMEALMVGEPTVP